MFFDDSGWLDDSDCEHEPTASFDDISNARRIIVMHYTAGYSAQSAISTFKSQAKPRSSPHFVIDVDGAITQMVSCDKVAWHAGGGFYHGIERPNEFSIGIEIVNPGYHWRDSDGGYLNWERKPVLPAKLAPFPGFTESYDEWVGSKALWPNFPSTQLDAVEQLTKALVKTYPSITDIVGHKDVDSVRRLKVDPGPAFPMARFKALLDNRRAPSDTLGTMIVTVPVLNVRGGPGTEFDKLDWGPLRANDQVQLKAIDKGWCYVEHVQGPKGNCGWAFAAYLRPLNDALTTPASSTGTISL